MTWYLEGVCHTLAKSTLDLIHTLQKMHNIWTICIISSYKIPSVCIISLEFYIRIWYSWYKKKNVSTKFSSANLLTIFAKRVFLLCSLSISYLCKFTTTYDTHHSQVSDPTSLYVVGKPLFFFNIKNKSGKRHILTYAHC